jgi:UDP-N-acetylglucosamine 2-epimerase (non-hydrolysing)
MRENTERPVTIEVGGNRLVGTDPAEITRRAIAIIRGEVAPPTIPTYWDGRAAERVVESLVTRFGKA